MAKNIYNKKVIEKLGIQKAIELTKKAAAKSATANKDSTDYNPQKQKV